jgi:hypothetical protein
MIRFPQLFEPVFVATFEQTAGPFVKRRKGAPAAEAKSARMTS